MNKNEKCTLWGILSGVGIIAAGATLVVATGGLALAAGGIGLGAALSGEVNAIQQACNDEKEFDEGSFFKNLAVGGVTGVISAGAGSAVSSLALKGAA